MRDDEKFFFRLCVRLRQRTVCPVMVRDVIDILHESGVIHYKRCYYLLEKWCGLGIYEYGVTIDLGWFLVEHLPERYALLLVKSAPIGALGCGAILKRRTKDEVVEAWNRRREDEK